MLSPGRRSKIQKEMTKCLSLTTDLELITDIPENADHVESAKSIYQPGSKKVKSVTFSTGPKRLKT